MKFLRSNELSICLKQLIIILILSTGFSLSAQEIGESDGGTTQAPKASRKNLKIRKGAKFTAAQYYAPIKDNEDRSNWPKKLTLVPETLSFEDMKKKLNGSWKSVWHCKGSAIPVNKFRGSGLGDGVVNLTSITTFDTKAMTASSLIIPAEDNKSRAIKKEPAKTEKCKFSYNPSDDYRFKLACDELNGFLKSVRIPETNQLVFEAKPNEEVFDENLICPDKTKPKILIVPFDFDTAYTS